MILSYSPFQLKFKHPFGVSGHTRSETLSVFIAIEENGLIGYGEACLPAYLGETLEGTVNFFKKAAVYLKSLNSQYAFEDILSVLDSFDSDCNAAKAAIDIALCDLYAKLSQQSFSDWQQIPFKVSMSTSFTIGIDNKEKIIQKIEEAKYFSILKIKAGTKDDVDLIKFIRQHSQKPLYVDVNQGWTNAEEALKIIDWMKDQGVLLIEQPLAKEQKKDMQWLSARSPLPIFADESVKRYQDLIELDSAFAGINIKLMKCTGLIEAIKMIKYCKLNHIQIFLGCMAESSCATGAMAQLMAFADYVDLDAPQLYLNDPFKGPTYSNGAIFIQKAPGIGVEPLVKFNWMN